MGVPTCYHEGLTMIKKMMIMKMSLSYQNISSFELYKHSHRRTNEPSDHG